ncbi:MAG: T9SS type A sorting domain-containing protein, partial [Bacteroidota bacterium]
QLRRVYAFDKATGLYSGMSQLPATAVTTNGFRCSYANGYVWLFNTGNRTWSSFRIFDGILNSPEVALEGEASRRNRVDLEWEGLFEENLVEYALERSLDGHAYEVIHTTAPLNNGQTNTYTHEDRDVRGEKILYYRIRLTTTDGATRRSNVVMITLRNVEEALFTLGPVPANTHFDITLENELDSEARFRIFDQQGKFVMEGGFSEHNPVARVETAQLADGVYNVLVMNGKMIGQKKVVVAH